MEPTVDPNNQQQPVQQQPAPSPAEPGTASKAPKRMLITTLIVAAIVFLAGGAWMLLSDNGDVSASNAAQVGISNTAFGPATLKIQKGQTVTWVNHDTAPHRVVADNKLAKGEADAFDSAPMALNESYTVTFEEAGTYNYHDELNPYQLKGKIIVE